MFTGIVECRGTLREAGTAAGGKRLCIEAPAEIVRDLSPGASVAVSGVCLTVSRVDGTHLEFDVVAQTLRATNLNRKKPGDALNLERSLRIGDRLDGHFVQGHIDGSAVVADIKATSTAYEAWFRAEEPLQRLMVPRGSVAIDGVSLTIAEVNGDRFRVALIPTTLERTTMSALVIGDVVNIESDIVVRTLLHQLDRFPENAGLSLDALREAGFA